MKTKFINLIICMALWLAPIVPTYSQAIPDLIENKIDSLFERWNTPTSPGCVIGVVRNDSLIFAKGYGSANLEYEIPNTPGSIYHTASISKQFTAYAIVLLVKEGKLNLDDDVRTYLPWFPDFPEKITIRHLKYTKGATYPDEVMMRYAGTYYSPELDCSYTIQWRDRQLYLTHSKYLDSKLTLIGPDHIQSERWWMNHLVVLRDEKIMWLVLKSIPAESCVCSLINSTNLLALLLRHFQYPL